MVELITLNPGSSLWSSRVVRPNKIVEPEISQRITIYFDFEKGVTYLCPDHLTTVLIVRLHKLAEDLGLKGNFGKTVRKWSVDVS
jgi:hypothetical protein